MAKFHVNSKGEPGECRASISCPFGGEADHYPTKEKAQEAYEAKHTAPVSVTKKVGELEPLPDGLTFGEHTLDDGRVVVINGFGSANWRSDCPRCASQGKGAFAPSHSAMPRCTSGGRDHCTCDGCF